MRYINPLMVEKAVALKNDWAKDAAAALDAVRAVRNDPKARAALINKKRIWGQLNELLGKLSNEKCWYCESTQKRSDMAVDHFRPKNSVAEDKADGYWWLAFDWKNYRYSCTYCNSRRVGDEGETGGKQDHFPLLGDRGTAEQSVKDLDAREKPALLDP